MLLKGAGDIAGFRCTKAYLSGQVNRLDCVKYPKSDRELSPPVYPPLSIQLALIPDLR